MYSNFKHLVMDNLQWWYRNGFFASPTEVIGRKMELGHAQKNMIWRPGGPAEDGCNCAHYNGWKSLNGLKHQTVDSAYGFTVDLFGPTSLRRNDLTLLREFIEE